VYERTPGLNFAAESKTELLLVLLTERAKRAKSPIRQDREFFLSSDICMSVYVCQSSLEATVFERF